MTEKSTIPVILRQNKSLCEVSVQQEPRFNKRRLLKKRGNEKRKEGQGGGGRATRCDNRTSEDFPARK